MYNIRRSCFITDLELARTCPTNYAELCTCRNIKSLINASDLILRANFLNILPVTRIEPKEWWHRLVFSDVWASTKKVGSHIFLEN